MRQQTCAKAPFQALTGALEREEGEQEDGARQLDRVRTRALHTTRLLKGARLLHLSTGPATHSDTYQVKEERGLESPSFTDSVVCQHPVPQGLLET